MVIDPGTFQEIQDLLQDAEDNKEQSPKHLKIYWEAKISAYKAVLLMIEKDNTK